MGNYWRDEPVFDENDVLEQELEPNYDEDLQTWSFSRKSRLDVKKPGPNYQVLLRFQLNL